MSSNPIRPIGAAGAAGPAGTTAPAHTATPTTTTTTTENTAAASGDAAGARTGQGVNNAATEAYGATEKLRHGINSFFDNTLQPNAARDAQHGTTAHHHESPAVNKDADMLSTGTAPTSSTGQSQGISGDARALGKSIKDALTSDSSHTKSTTTNTGFGSAQTGTTGTGTTATGSSGSQY